MKTCKHCNHPEHPWVRMRHRPIIAHLDGEVGRCPECECAVDISGELHKINYTPRKTKVDDKSLPKDRNSV